MVQERQSTISVNSPRVKPGESVTVTGTPHKRVYVVYKNKGWFVNLNGKGQAKIRAPGEAGEEFSISDVNYPRPRAVRIKIVSSFK